jgi:hypothetical protein
MTPCRGFVVGTGTANLILYADDPPRTQPHRRIRVIIQPRCADVTRRRVSMPEQLPGCRPITESSGADWSPNCVAGLRENKKHAFSKHCYRAGDCRDGALADQSIYTYGIRHQDDPERCGHGRRRGLGAAGNRAVGTDFKLSVHSLADHAGSACWALTFRREHRRRHLWHSAGVFTFGVVAARACRRNE